MDDLLYVKNLIRGSVVWYPLRLKRGILPPKNSKRLASVQSGFTLIELLIVIIIIATLAVVVFVALNPLKRLQDARNARRTADVETILTAIHEYIVDNKGTLPPSISGGTVGTDYQIGNGTCSTPIVAHGCNTSGARCANMGADLTSYLKSVPIDPLGSSTYVAANTGYAVSYDANSIITVKACGAEGGTLPSFDATTNGKYPYLSLGASLTWNHTTGTQSNRILLVGVTTRSQTVSSVTYNGVNLSRVNNSLPLACSANCKADLWYMLNPPAGAYNVVVTLPASDNGWLTANSATYFNVDQTNPFGTFATNIGTGSSSSLTVSSNTNQLVIDYLGTEGISTINNPGAGQTYEWYGSPGTGSAESDKPGNATSISMSWNFAGSQNWAEAAVPINYTPVIISQSR